MTISAVSSEMHSTKRHFTLGFTALPARWIALFWLSVGVLLCFSPSANAQSYGPPAIQYGGYVFYFSSTITDPNTGDIYDAYYGPAGEMDVDQFYSVYAGYDGGHGDNFCSYDPVNFTISSSVFAVTSDGTQIRPAPPQYITATGPSVSSPVNLTLIGIDYSSGAGWFNEALNYQDSTQTNIITIHRYYGGGFSGDISGTLGGEYFSGSYSGNFDPATIAAAPLSDPSISISFPSSLPSPARVGPPYISWNGLLLTYSYTDPNGIDYYADNANVAQVTINNGSATSGSGPSGAVSGSYNTGTQTFSVNVGNFFAMDDNKSPIGLPTGFLVDFGYSGFGNTILVSTGGSTSVTNVSYTYQRPDGTWISEYAGLPANARVLISDNVGNYNSQIYLTQDTTNQSQLINAVPGWPPTNLYPTWLYVNDVPCQIQAGSQYDSGGGLPRNGGVSYRALIYDLTVVLSWSWDSVTGFHGYVTGQYGQSSSFGGNWDGLSGFGNLTAGVTVSLGPSGQPSYGPPQVAVNGAAFNFDPSSSGQGSNPVDVYRGVLGQSLTIDGAGYVTFYDASGAAAATGKYNPITHQFSFGIEGNTVTISGANGGGPATITATDTVGHNLATTKGSGSNGGITELAGGLDVQGNTLTLGSWTAGSGESLYGFGLAYGDAATGSSQLQLSTARAAVDWVWIHPSTDGNVDQVISMTLDSTHRVQLYDPTPGKTANIGVMLDPNGASGNSGVGGTFRVWQRGDILMGEFTNGTHPPVPDGATN